MASALPTLTVVAGLIQQADALLICQRKQDGDFALKWEFPGGKVEPGETLEGGLQRELKEELGIDAYIGPVRYRTQHHYPNQYTVNLIFYDITSFQGTPQNLVFEQIHWVKSSALATYDFLDGDAELINMLSQA